MLVTGTCAPALTIESDFEGASVRVVKTDDATQTIHFMPGGDPKRGWACWWQFRVTGLDISKPLTLELQASDLPMPQANGSPTNKPLSGAWSMPDQASYSLDGKTWKHTDPGKKADNRMIYTLKVEAPAMLVAWGPPYTPATASAYVRSAASGAAAFSQELELCKSREGRSVPMIRVSEGDRAKAQRFGVWVQARQHAWEAGSSWVCQGFAEWLLGSDPEAAWLRQHAEIFIVPIMDIDNTATGNGGKEALPHDHNRDWMEKPNWNEVAAAQAHIREFSKQQRMDVFLDLHNPGASDKKAFFYALPAELLKEPMLTNRNRFIELATANIGEVFPMLDKPKEDGPKYHPLWRQISGTWVSMNTNAHTVGVCLETSWNTPKSTIGGYKAVGAHLGKALHKYLAERLVKQ